MKHAIDLLVYISVGFGIPLLAQLSSLVPPWLFYSVLVAWISYIIVAVAVATHHESAYPFVLALIFLSLSFSLPQPEHYQFFLTGKVLAVLSFVAGSVLQIALLVFVSIYFLRKNR